MTDNPWDFAQENGSSVTVKLPPPKPVASSPVPKKSSTRWDFVNQAPEETNNEVGPGVDRDLREFGEGAGRGVVTALPYLADVLNSLNIPLVPHLPGSPPSDIKDAVLGRGNLTKAVNDWFNTNYQTVTPQNKLENVLSTAGQGVGAGIFGGAPGVISGITGGVGSEAAHEAFPNSEWAPFIGGILGGVLPAGPHIVEGAHARVIMSRGANHPDYATFVDNVIPALEGGGTVENPKTNPKSGAFGPMQVTPETLRQPGYGIKPWDGTVADSIRVGRQKFAALLGKFKGDTEKALAGYNWGEGNVDKAVRRYGNDWLQHAPEETQNYVGKGMLRAYGGGDLPANESVAAMAPEDIAGIMNDPEAAGPEMTPLQPVDTGNVTDLGAVRAALDNQKVRALVEDKLDTAAAHNEAIQDGVSDLTPEEVTRNRVTAEQLNDMLPDDHPYKGMTEDLMDTWRQNEQEIYKQHGMMPPSLRDADLTDGADAVVGQGSRREPLNDMNEADAEDRAGLYGKPEPEANPQDVIDEAVANRQPPPEGALGGRSGRARQQIKDSTEPPRKSEDGHPEDDMPPPSDEPTVRKFIELMEGAKPVSRKQQILISKQRGERFQKAAQIYATQEGPAAARMAKAAMKGTMNKVRFEPIVQHFDANEIQFLFNKVTKSNRLTPGEKMTGTDGLEKLLSADGGDVPTQSELNVLAQVFPKELIDAAQKEGKFARFAAQALNTPRTIMASFDLSAPFRQGVFLVGRKEFYKAWYPMLRSFFSEKYFQASQAEIASRPTFRLMQKAGLALTEEGGPLMKREEQFMANWVEKVPVAGTVVRASSRAYMGFLNKLRADTFDTLIRQAANEGLDLEHDYHALHSIARFVNNATGRGDLGRWNTAAPVLNGLFFSPRLIASRVNMMNPVWYATLHPFARKQALKSLLSFSAIALTILGLAKMGGADVEPDPRSADFGKIKTGNTRYDILGGFQQFIRAGAQILTGSKKTEDGEMQNLDSGKFGQDTRLDVAQNFVYNKTSPVASFVVDWLRGSDAVGRPFTYKRELLSRVVPMVAQDANDLRNDGLHNGGGNSKMSGVLPGVFGVGVQTYQPRKAGTPGRPPKSDWDFAAGESNPWDFETEGEFK